MTSPAPARRRAGAGRLASAVRIALWLDASAVLVQALLAGRLLEGDEASLSAHDAGAAAVFVVSLALVGLALPAWRRGDLPGWTAGTAVGVLVAVGVQAAAGATGALGIHLPLGALMLCALVVAALGTAGRTA